MKRRVGLLLSLAVIVSLISPLGYTHAADSEKIPAVQLDDAIRESLMDIPIFIVASENSRLTEEQKDDVNASIVNYCAGTNQALINDSDEYDIIPLNDEQKQSVLENPIYTSTFERVQEMIDSGLTVKYVNLFSDPFNVTGTQRASDDQNDTAYWEKKCTSLGTYNGYKFLYLEASSGVETSLVTPGNLSSSLKWGEIAKKSITVVCDHYVKGTFYKAVKAIDDALSTLFNSYGSPLNISYTPSSNQYLKTRVSGQIYLRTVLIRDDLNRIDGYAYYPWGTTEKLEAALRVETKYPSKQNPSGTYEYTYTSYTYPKQATTTPGYSGNATFYKSLIQLYTNTTGYFTHEESIDIRDNIESMLS